MTLKEVIVYLKQEIDINDLSIELPCGMVKQILELLESKVPVEPCEHVINEDELSSIRRWYTCGQCKCQVFKYDRYCKNCGKEIKWK